jgi:hypothetical protein
LSLCILYGIILFSKFCRRKNEKNTEFEATTFPYQEFGSEIKLRVPINQRQVFNRGNRQYTIESSLVRCVFQSSPFESWWGMPKRVINFFSSRTHRMHVCPCCVIRVTVERSTSSSQIKPCPVSALVRRETEENRWVPIRTVWEKVRRFPTEIL